ncbi:hypothetical protein P3T76_010485 [Phytophthora citrophthora]|uniref:M96 mating-specific protein family n=1 Tax=Phytophthora citrophthora TaxID=4793 RepID=A0AAD9GCJ0_9STRA|nr:hypothetical protein P3T76_010485 [Phytophthora citrophthora]
MVRIMCVTDLPGDPDGVLVLHDVMELVDEAYEPGEGSTSANASPIIFDSDDEDLDVPPLRPRRSSRRNSSHRRHQQDERCSGAAESDDQSLGVTSLAARPVFGSPAMLDFGGDDTDEDVMGGVYHGAVTAKLKQPMEQWRLKSTITDVSVTRTPTARIISEKTKPVKTKPVSEAKGTPQRRMNPKDEVQYLRGRVRQLEQTLETLRLQALADKEKAMETAIVFNLVPQPELLAPSNNNPGSPAQTQTVKVRGSPAGVDSMASQNGSVASSEGLWERIATFQKAEYEKSMKQNKRLRVMAEQQLRALKQLEVAFRNPRALCLYIVVTVLPSTSEDVPDLIIVLSSLCQVIRALQSKNRPEKLFHGSLFDNEAAIFDSLRVELETQYRQTDNIFQSAGLAHFEGDMACSAALRSSGDGVFLENSECKVFPFSLNAVDQAVWQCLADRDAEFHPGLYEVREVTDDVVAVKISDLVQLPSAETRVTVWLTVKRFYEWSDDGRKRIICVWNAMVQTEGSLDIRLHERGWNVLRPLTYTACVDPSCTMSFTQTCMRISPLCQTEFPASAVAVGTLANVLVGCYHRTVIVMHHVLEKLLLVEDTRCLLG